LSDSKSGVVRTGRPAGGRLGEDRELEILQATFELLGEVGYEGLRLDAVAGRARTSKATLYRHWPGKAQLVADAVRACQDFPQDLPDTGDLREDLLEVLRRAADHMTGEDGPLMAGLLMAMRSDEELARELRAAAASRPDLGAEICARAVARGQLVAGYNPGLFEEICPALLFFRSFVVGEPLDEVYLAHVVDDILLPLLTG
jgi:AcrR family transcriptional regulator